MQELVLTIDLGTSGPKVALFDTQGKIVESKFEEVPLLLFENGGAEQRPSDWIEGLKKCYFSLIAETKVNPKQIIAINCTSQWSGTVAVDQQGSPLMNSVIWMDSRGAEDIKKLFSGGIPVEGYNLFKLLKWLKITGGAPSKTGKDSLAHILYIKSKLPTIYSKTYKFLEPKDYLNLYFTGIFAASFDSITLHWLTDNRKINDIRYDDSLLKLTGIERAKLPDLVPTNSILGNVSAEIAKEFGLNENTKVVSGAGDIHSAGVGSGAVKDFEGHLYFGTSSWLVCHLPFKKTDVLHNIGTIPSALPGKYMLANEQQTTGACLSFLKTILFDSEPPKDFYKQVDKAAEKVAPGSEGLMFLPWLYGERSPVDDSYARGGFYNLSLNNTRAHLLRSVLEGVAMNTRWLLMYVEKLTGKPFEAINFIGGGANSALWAQILADVCNRTIRTVKDPLTANSRGTALLALIALGKLSIDEVSQRVEIERAFTPNAQNRPLYDRLFENFVTIYKRNKPIFTKLNQL